MNVVGMSCMFRDTASFAAKYATILVSSKKSQTIARRRKANALVYCFRRCVCFASVPSSDGIQTYAVFVRAMQDTRRSALSRRRHVVKGKSQRTYCEITVSGYGSKVIVIFLFVILALHQYH